MKNMKNSRPFDIILDSYSNESAQLYAVVRTLLNYPSITEDEDLEGKLYASAFTFIVQDYLDTSNNCFHHDDFELFIEEMNFKIDEEIINKMFINLKLQLKDNDEGLFKEVVWALIKHYEKSIKKDLGNLFVKKDKLIKLFASIYSLSDDVYMPNAQDSDFEFFNDFK
jgi:hypothetical protein